jgi:SSS family solute:Na+ symporter
VRTIDIVVVILYLIGMLGIGVFARGKISSLDDFILGGKRFKVLPLTATIMTTMTGAGMTLGMVGAVSRRGSGIFWDLTGVALGLFVMAAIAARLRETNKRSLAEVIAGKNGAKPQIAVALIAAFYTIVLTGQNMAAVGRLLNYAGSDIGITSTQATVFAAIIMTAYTALGGLYAVVWTDFIQFLVMMVTAGIIGPIIAVSVSGGIAPIAANLGEKGLSLFNPSVGNAFWPSFTFALVMLLGVPGDPTSPQRVLAARDAPSARRAFALAGLSMFWWAAALTIIGGAACYLMPNIAEEWKTAEAAFPVFAIRYFPPILTGLAFAGMLAAVMSTADSMLLLCATHIVYDIAMKIAPDKLSERSALKILPWATVVLGIFALFIALRITSLLATMYFVFSMVSAAFIVPMAAQLYFSEKCTSIGVTAGVLAGGLVTIVMYQTNYMGPGGDPVYTGMAASALCVFIGSFFKSNPQGEAR